MGEGGGRFRVGGWMEWRKVKEEEGLEWGNGRSGGMVKEEEWLKRRNGGSGEMIGVVK